MMIPDLVAIQWLDAHAEAGWQQVGAKETPEHCLTVGFIVFEDRTCVTVASTISDSESNARITIPGQWIVKRWKVPFKVR